MSQQNKPNHNNDNKQKEGKRILSRPELSYLSFDRAMKLLVDNLLGFVVVTTLSCAGVAIAIVMFGVMDKTDAVVDSLAALSEKVEEVQVQPEVSPQVIEPGCFSISMVGGKVTAVPQDCPSDS